MSKNQKLWFWVGAVFFLVPEIFLTGGISSFVGFKVVPLINTTKWLSAYPAIGYILIILEAFGLGLLLFINRSHPYKHLILKYIVTTILLLLLFCVVALFYFGYVFAYRVSFP